MVRLDPFRPLRTEALRTTLVPGTSLQKWSGYNTRQKGANLQRRISSIHGLYLGQFRAKSGTLVLLLFVAGPGGRPLRKMNGNIQPREAENNKEDNMDESDARTGSGNKTAAGYTMDIVQEAIWT